MAGLVNFYFLSCFGHVAKFGYFLLSMMASVVVVLAKTLSPAVTAFYFFMNKKKRGVEMEEIEEGKENPKIH
jgi:hypothetical protein